MARWWMKTYVSESGREAFAQWFKKQTKRCRAKFLRRMAQLSDLPKEKWEAPPHYPYAKRLKRDGKGLWEVRILVEKKQVRPIGYFGPGKSDYTFLIGAEEKSGKFVPKNTIETAQKRKKCIEEGRCKAIWIRELKNSSSQS